MTSSEERTSAIKLLVFAEERGDQKLAALLRRCLFWLDPTDRIYDQS